MKIKLVIGKKANEKLVAMFNMAWSRSVEPKVTEQYNEKLAVTYGKKYGWK
jgi:hypothetical protein